MNNTILLHSGNYFDFANLKESRLSIEDIAHGLSNTCRFSGHCNRFYSVAEHCFFMSYYVPLEYAECALLHDASESVLTDIPKPLKNMLPDYVKCEMELEAAIAEQYDIPFPYPPEIKTADRRMLITERNQLFPEYIRKDNVWDNIEPFDLKIYCYNPETIKNLFLDRYYQLKEM